MYTPVHTVNMCVYLCIHVHEKKAQNFLWLCIMGSREQKGKVWQSGNWNFLKH